jgi:hypothetical protein
MCIQLSKYSYILENYSSCNKYSKAEAGGPRVRQRAALRGGPGGGKLALGIRFIDEAVSDASF